MTETHDDGREPPPKLAGGDEGTGLVWPRSWPMLYTLVVVVFATWVAILYALTRKFS
jgi:hypothetical protein